MPAGERAVPERHRAAATAGWRSSRANGFAVKGPAHCWVKGPREAEARRSCASRYTHEQLALKGVLVECLCVATVPLYSNTIFV